MQASFVFETRKEMPLESEEKLTGADLNFITDISSQLEETVKDKGIIATLMGQGRKNFRWYQMTFKDCSTEFQPSLENFFWKMKLYYCLACESRFWTPYTVVVVAKERCS